MALKKRRLKEDLLWLKWSILMLIVVLFGSLMAYMSAFDFRNEMQREEFQELANLDLISGQIREIEAAERVIIENIDKYNSLVDAAILEEEDRVSMLEDIRGIREKHKLYPISIDISEQQRTYLPYSAEVQSPQEQISLRSSAIQIEFPLLHEEDLARFLTDFMQSGRLIINHRCSIDELVRAAESSLDVTPHQQASCNFTWYTLRREPYTGS